MLREVSGDILLSKADAIVHGVAPMDPFHHGLALSLREQWPAMYSDFRHYCQTYHPKPGTLWTWAGVGGARVISLFTQEPAPTAGAHPGKATLSHLNHCLKSLKKEVATEGLKSLALPRLATGVGGLEWKQVQPLLQESLNDLAIPVYVYSLYKKGQPASEH